jgi:hypothetical protein
MRPEAPCGEHRAKMYPAVGKISSNAAKIIYTIFKSLENKKRKKKID